MLTASGNAYQSLGSRYRNGRDGTTAAPYTQFTDGI
jgi:hypothetical protein